MTKLETIDILCVMGISRNMSDTMVTTATKEGKSVIHHLIAIAAQTRTITVHHGMIGNTTHTYSIEIN